MTNGFNVASIGLIFLAFGLVGVELAVNKWIRKVTNTYWFWLGWSLFYIIYAILISWGKFWNLFAHINLPDRLLTTYESSLVSRGLLLNLCPFLNFALPLTLIADPSRKAARSLAPLAIIGSCVVLLGDLTVDKDVVFSWRYIFIGHTATTDLYYFGHTMNLLMGMAIVLNTPKCGWKSLAGTYGTLAVYLAYVSLMASVTGCQYGVTGMRLTDFTKSGNYSVFAYIGLSPQAAAAIHFPLLFGTILGTTVLIDVCKRKYFAYGDKYSGCWWRYYDYEKTTIKEPWGWFSHNWQLKHKKQVKNMR